MKKQAEMPFFACGIAAVPLHGETVSGDLHIVQAHADGVLLGVVDGLGHGSDAAFAAKIAVATLEQYASEPLYPLLKRCHEMLRKTRGVAVCLASYNRHSESMSWLAIGNVEGLLLSRNSTPARSVLQVGGVVGYRLPRLGSVSEIPLHVGDTLFLASDGIREDFAQRLRPAGTPQEMADGIVAASAKGTDDALVLVARYLGVTA